MGRSVANSLLLPLIWTAFVLTTLKMDPQFVSVYINRKICTKLENIRVIMNGNSAKPVLSLKIKIGLRSLRSGCALIHLPQSELTFMIYQDGISSYSAMSCHLVIKHGCGMSLLSIKITFRRKQCHR